MPPQDDHRRNILAVEALPADETGQRDNPYVATADAWNRPTAQDREREERASAAMRDLGVLALDLSRVESAAARAAVTGDVDRLCDTSETLLTMHARYAELYRDLLVIRITSTRKRTGPELSSS